VDASGKNGGSIAANEHGQVVLQETRARKKMEIEVIIRRIESNSSNYSVVEEPERSSEMDPCAPLDQMDSRRSVSSIEISGLLGTSGKKKPNILMRMPPSCVRTVHHALLL